jgi:hypothetical protein
MLKIVTTATKIIQEHDIVYAGDGYFKSKENGIITYNYLYNWLKINGYSEMCYKQNFYKLIEQIIFEIEILF